ncbi:glycosyltransferase [Filimonas effusa]|uniref:Glycosyltransferase n=1 Tax=Filimonas effusa TaxID=2508721 RepID=A0A4Q1DCZ1_9BACT|nr:glycosyltransferase [Filimonas effusa]RXK87342.1 glycosyltransferase [Filimonas effusa]
MRILIIHTYYQFKGGEDLVFEQESALLMQKHEVRKLVFKNNSGIKGAIQFLFSIWNPVSSAPLKKMIRTFKPQIIHIHNFHFALGPLVIRVANRRGIPVVLTLHNYRLLCPSATLLKDGKIFSDSINSGFPWKAVFAGVYRNSVLQTFWLAYINWIHKKSGTWNKVDRFITLTDFARRLFINSALNIDNSRFSIKPNFVEKVISIDSHSRDEYFLFIGRLSQEKGIDLLLDAFERTNARLLIAGDGPLKDLVVSYCSSRQNIEYLGPLGKEEVLGAMRRCSALIFPSIWFEGMPMTILEAFSTGTPVIASKLGAMESMIQHGQNGLLFEYGSATALWEVLNYWNTLDINERRLFSQRAYDSYLLNYTPEISLNILDEIYSELGRISD